MLLKAQLIGTLFLYSALVRGAEELPTILWHITDRPPITILQGEHEGQGTMDRIYSRFLSQLPMYQHEKKLMNVKRTWHNMEQGKLVCVSGTFKNTNRAAIAHFSQPVGFVIPYRIITTKNNWQRLGSPDSISISDLLERNLRLATEAGRSYSQQIDRLLAAPNHKTKVERYAPSNENLLEMLRMGRFDYFLETPTMIGYLLRSEHEISSQLVSIEIEELPPFLLVYFACARNSEGKKIINKINDIVADETLTDSYRNILTAWYFDPHDIEKIEYFHKYQFPQLLN